MHLQALYHNPYSTNLEDLVAKYDYFLFDCDGVLWSGPTEIAGSFKALEFIIQKGKKVFLVTNNSTKPRESIQKEKLAKFGYEDLIAIEQIYNSGYVTGKYLMEEVIQDKENDKVYVVGEQGLKDEMKRWGIKVANEEHDPQLDMSTDEFASREVDKNVKAVICGICFSYNFRMLCLASLYLELNNAAFIATNKDKVIATNVPGRYLPAGGSIVASIEFSTKVTPTLMGKPNRLLFDIIREDHKLQDEPLSKFLMVGDSLNTDIKFGNNCGIDTLLVLSGNTTESKALKALQSAVHEHEGVPTYVSPFLAYSKNLQLTE